MNCLRKEKVFSLVRDEEEMYAFEGNRKLNGRAYLTSFMVNRYLASLSQ